MDGYPRRQQTIADEASGLKVYLVRHGQSVENAQGLQHRLSYAAFNDFLYEAPSVPLTNLGIQQACQAASVLRDKYVERLYASPFARAFKTATVLGQMLQLTPLVMSDLSEIVPEPFRPSARIAPAFLLYLHGYLRIAYTHNPRQSRFGIYQRARRVWRDVTREPVTAVALVSHYAFIHVLLVVALLEWRCSLRSYDLNNGGITCLELS